MAVRTWNVNGSKKIFGVGTKTFEDWLAGDWSAICQDELSSGELWSLVPANPAISIEVERGRAEAVVVMRQRGGQAVVFLAIHRYDAAGGFLGYDPVAAVPGKHEIAEAQKILSGAVAWMSGAGRAVVDEIAQA